MFFSETLEAIAPKKMVNTMLEAIQNGDDWGDLSLPYGLVVSCHYLTQ
jgi:hypothetical protein